jgi:hypothetical protein
MAPAIVVMFWGQRRAKSLGALAIADPGYAQRQLLANGSPRPTLQAILVGLFWQVDIIGLLLLAFGLGCFLVPFSLAANAEGGYANRESRHDIDRCQKLTLLASMIALLCVGFVLLIATGVYESKYAPYPIMPRRVGNRALICACLIDAFYWMSYCKSHLTRRSTCSLLTLLDSQYTSSHPRTS